MDHLLCNQIGHLNQPIIALCTFQVCRNIRSCCGKCIMAHHKSHFYSVFQLEDLQSKYDNTNHLLLSQVDDLRKKMNQMLSQIKNSISLIPLYPQEINVINLNKFADQLAYSETIDSIKIKELLLLSSQTITSTLKRCLNFIKQGNKEQLEMRMTEALKLRNLGDALNKQGQHQESIEFYDRSIEIYEQDDDCWNKKGYALGNLWKYEQAIECYNQAILINPNYSNYYSNKAYMLWRLNKQQEALDCVNKGLNLNSNHASSWGNKGSILKSMNQKEEALKCFEKAVDIAPDAIKLFKLALFLEELDRKNEALKYYQQAVKLNPDYQDAINKVKQLSE